MRGNRYPWLSIRSKSELSRHITHGGFSRERGLKLINDVLSNRDKYWKDSRRSDPEKEKYVRSAKGTPLGLLLDKINKKVLAPHDRLLPDFIFGGVQGLSHVKAASHLLGQHRKRTLLKLDISRFFEQVSRDRVTAFFQHKCGCSKEGARLLSYICCVPFGPKGSKSDRITIARGFATSSRLAVWCNLDLFIKLDRLVKNRLKGKDPRIAIYVDDIGITATNVTEAEMESLFVEIQKLLATTDRNQPLPLNPDKKHIVSHKDGMEHLGIKLLRNRLAIGNKTTAKRQKIKNQFKRNLSPWDKVSVKRRLRSMNLYKQHVERKD